jgi:methyl-accepting chemotaxis protein/aerotaxis receptor
MRDTGTVTQRECPLQADDVLISRTDGSGVIRWANEGFQRISGFSAEELIGKPHNLVRHPDMPRAASVDLWSTVRRGEAWRGIVKNRCKHGDHDWVEADAAGRARQSTIERNNLRSVFVVLSVRRDGTSM